MRTWLEIRCKCVCECHVCSFSIWSLIPTQGRCGLAKLKVLCVLVKTIQTLYFHVSSCMLMRECLTWGIFSPGADSQLLYLPVLQTETFVPLCNFPFFSQINISFHKTFKTMFFLWIILISVLKNQDHVMMVDLNLINRNWLQLLLCTVWAKSVQVLYVSH